MPAGDPTVDDEVETGSRGFVPTTRSLAIGVGAGLVMALIAVVFVLSRPSEYVSQATLLIDQPRALAASGSEGLVVKLSRLRVKYADLASADLVVDPVAQQTGIRPGDVRRETTAFAPAQTLTVVVSARSGGAERAQQLSQAVASQLSTYTDAEQESLGIPDDQRVTLTVIDEAGRGSKVTPTASRALAVGLIAFVLGTLVVAIGLPLLDDARR